MDIKVTLAIYSNSLKNVMEQEHVDRCCNVKKAIQISEILYTINFFTSIKLSSNFFQFQLLSLSQMQVP